MIQLKSNFSMILKDWNGEEILVLEEDIILSPDFIKAYWFASRIYRTVGSRDLFVSGAAMGGWSGENIVRVYATQKGPSFFFGSYKKYLRTYIY